MENETRDEDRAVLELEVNFDTLKSDINNFLFSLLPEQTTIKELDEISMYVWEKAVKLYENK